MKETRRILNSLIACAVALAVVSTLTAQSADQSAARVVRLKGAAQYKIGNGDWRPLKVGDVLREGTVIQTAGNSHVDFLLGGAAAAVARPVVSDMVAYRPTAEQNIVRVWENTLMGIDRLTEMQTGADVVTETQLDLKAGRISGSVKKMSAASKYEVKLPIGVAGIRGTIFDITAEGVIKVFSGSVVLGYTGPNGSTLTQLIMTLQQFDARTGILSPLSDPEKSAMERLLSQLRSGLTSPLLAGGLIAPDFPLVPIISAASINVSIPTPPPVSPH
jgi:hypothetical protein